jgi:hypothetical protein
MLKVKPTSRDAAFFRSTDRNGTEIAAKTEVCMSLRRMKYRSRATQSFIAIFLNVLLCCASTTVNGQSQKDIDVFLTVAPPKVVSDFFGKRIADRFIVVQVTVTNSNADYQYLVQDVSLSFKDVYVGAPIPATVLARKISPYKLSSISLSLLRGVAEKGQGQDPRNKVLRFLTAIGTVGGALVGVAGFGPSYSDSMAVFNGPVLSAYRNAFPDYTINQVNRLNDSAYEPNTLIGKQQGKVIVAFIPQEIFLTKQQQRDFWNEPMKLFEEIDLRRIDAIVQGNHIVNLSNLPPFVTDIQIDASEMAKFQNAQPEVKGYIIGRFLTGTTISFSAVTPEDFVPPILDGPPTETRLNFILKSSKPVQPGKQLSLRVANSQGVQIHPVDVAYTPVPPTLTGAPVPATGAKGAPLKVTLTGTGFIPSVTKVMPVSGTGITVTSVKVISGTTLEVELAISATASSGAHTLAADNGNNQSNTVTITVP